MKRRAKDRVEVPADPEERKFYVLVHPGAPGGVTYNPPKPQAQDRRAKSAEMYVVAFFPKIKLGGKRWRAEIGFYNLRESLSQTPETAIAKYMDHIAKGEKWETYAHAGHRVRKIRIVDLGDAERGNPKRPRFSEAKSRGYRKKWAGA